MPEKGEIITRLKASFPFSLKFPLPREFVNQPWSSGSRKAVDAEKQWKQKSSGSMRS